MTLFYAARAGIFPAGAIIVKTLTQVIVTQVPRRDSTIVTAYITNTGYGTIIKNSSP